MNRIYRLVWNRVRGCLVVASEIARARGKHGRAAAGQRQRWLLALPLGLAPLFALAASPSTMAAATRLPMTAPVIPAIVSAISPSVSPSGGQVAAGSGNISHSGLTTTIDQHSQNLSLNWQSFNIGADSTVNFVQPNAQAIAVNRIADPSGSVILGRLNANGQVFLINPNGVLFGRGAQVNVGGLVASTLEVSDSELGGGALHFTGDSQGGVVNHGKITAKGGGYVALVGAQVVNDGTLAANGGSVAMGGGNAVTLSFDGNRLLGLQVDGSALNALAENRQLIVADGGQVLMSAGAKDTLLASTVNNSGVIQARTVENRDGRIILLGGMEAGTTHVAGTLDASAPTGGDGGFIETSAAHVKVADGARITTLAANGDNGTWLIDPQDFTIAASGGDMTGASLSSYLGGSNVAIESSAGAIAGNGDIFVIDAVNWNANTLTLTAARNIDINAVMTAGGTAGLALNPRTANGADAVSNSNTSTVNIMPGLGRVDFTGTGNSLHINGTPYTFVTSLAELQAISGDLGGHYALRNNIDASATASWNPDGSGGFAGFDPLGIDEYSGTPFSGAFDGLGHTIDNLTINRPTTDNVGLFGYLAGDSIVRNVGLQGGSTRGGDNTGALVGYNSDHGLISNAYATGNVRGGDNVGGLIGYHNGAPAHHLYATGDVEGSGNVGGLLGLGVNTSLYHAYASGNVRGNSAGGLVGALESFSLWYAYATGDVTGTSSAGGLVGTQSHGTVWRSYATSKVTGGTSTGGLIGNSEFTTVIYGYWDEDSTGQAQVCGGAGASTCSSAAGAEPIGLNTADAFHQASYANLDFDKDWYMVEGQTRPFLRFEHTTSISNAHQLQLVNMDLSASYALASDIDASMTDGARASGMWSGNGFSPIGDAATPFSGIFDGLGHHISNLTIRPTGSPSYVGLFGATAAGSEVRNVGLIDVSLAGGNGQVGALVGRNQGKVSNSYATGTVIGATHVGGLIGDNLGTVDGSYFSGSAIAGNRLGGLVGVNTGSISNSYSTGEVRSSAAQDLIGGLVGDNSGGTVSGSYASATVLNGNTDPNRHTGSLVGNNSGTVTNSYWNLGASTLPGIDGGTVTGATGLTAAQMMQQSSFVGWDIAGTGGSSAVWRIYEGHTAPLLRSFMTGLVVTADNVATTYNGAAFAGSTDYTFGALTPNKWLPSADVDPSLLFGSANTATPAINAGSYALGNGLYSGQMGYDIGFTGGTLTINPAALTIGSSDVSKTYDGGLGAAGSAVVTGGTLFGTDALSGGSFAFIDKNAGSHKTVSVAGVTVDDGNGGGNYTVTYADNTTSTIFAKAIAHVGGIGADSKIYDGNAAATLDLGGATFAGMIAGDDLAVAGAVGSFGDKSAANDKTVAIGAITLGGTDAGNYVLTDDTASATADIVRRAVNVDTAASDKIYDGTTGATLSVGSAGILAGDTVEFAGTGSFADKNVGAGKAVSIDSLITSGADAGNYVYLINPAGAADITPLGITVDATASDKVYDATTNAVVALGSSGILAGDTVTFDGTGSFDNKNAGTGKTVAVTGIAANGADAGNYNFNTTATDTVDITKLDIAVGATASNKIYDATTNAVVALGSSGVLIGDTVTLTGTGHFADKNVGTAKAVTVDLDASGTDAGNYAFHVASGTTADITPATLVYQADPATFPLGQAWSPLGGTVSGLVGGDTLAEATDGALTWQTPATATSPVGAYAIDGSGLSALNYLFVQAPGNATALQVTDGSVPDPVGVPGLVASTVAGLQQSDDNDEARAPYAPDVHIVNGGVRLP
jgi:trimeric autotransporter adhesin